MLWDGPGCGCFWWGLFTIKPFDRKAGFVKATLPPSGGRGEQQQDRHRASLCSYCAIAQHEAWVCVTSDEIPHRAACSHFTMFWILKFMMYFFSSRQNRSYTIKKLWRCFVSPLFHLDLATGSSTVKTSTDMAHTVWFRFVSVCLFCQLCFQGHKEKERWPQPSMYSRGIHPFSLWELLLQNENGQELFRAILHL